jgi:ketosteroid isomerase-like protein
MSQQNVDLVRTAYRAYNHRDPEAVLACFDPDIDWHVPDSLAWGDHVRGLEAIGKFFEGLKPYMGDDHEVEISSSTPATASSRSSTTAGRRRAASATTSRRSWCGRPPAAS